MKDKLWEYVNSKLRDIPDRKKFNCLISHKTEMQLVQIERDSHTHYSTIWLLSIYSGLWSTYNIYIH